MNILGSAAAGLSELSAPDFDLAATLNSGQVFHWRPTAAGHSGVVGDRAIYAEQRGDKLWVTSGCEDLAAWYFALDHPMPEIYASFPADALMKDALTAAGGLRIIRQPLWECLATFITSALKQVAHIAQISHLLRERFGVQVGSVGGRQLFSYPSAARIASLQEADLRACGLGFRARSLLETARAVGGAETQGEKSLEAIRELDDATALATLRNYRGVGTKVANCVLLFAYQRLNAFPIDVWIERVLRERYFHGDPTVPVVEMQRFSAAHFGPYGGYVQQFLFHQARMAARKPPPTAGATVPMRRVRRQPLRNPPL